MRSPLTYHQTKKNHKSWDMKGKKKPVYANVDGDVNAIGWILAWNLSICQSISGHHYSHPRIVWIDECVISCDHAAHTLNWLLDKIDDHFKRKLTLRRCWGMRWSAFEAICRTLVTNTSYLSVLGDPWNSIWTRVSINVKETISRSSRSVSRVWSGWSYWHCHEMWRRESFQPRWL